MAIIATNTAQQRELIEAGNYIARCYQMLHIGTVQETILGETKILNKVRIGWELPTELKTFSDEKGEQPCVISKEFTLSMNEKSNLRKLLASWRGKDFSEEEAKAFDITNLLGKACMINIIHKPSKDGTKTYQEIAGCTPMPRGMECPSQINNNMVWDYDHPDMQLLANLPDFIKDKIKSSLEFVALGKPMPQQESNDENNESTTEDLPF